MLWLVISNTVKLSFLTTWDQYYNDVYIYLRNEYMHIHVSSNITAPIVLSGSFVTNE